MKKGIIPSIAKKLESLGNKQGAIKLQDLAKEMNLGEEETLQFLREIFPSGAGIEICTNETGRWVDIKSDCVEYLLPLTPGEWIKLHEILYHHIGIETEASLSLKKKVIDAGPTKAVMDLLNQLEIWDHEISLKQQDLVKQIEQSVVEKHLISLTTKQAKKYSLRPCKLLHLEGQLSVIAEDSYDHCLVVLQVKDIDSFETISTGSVSKVSVFEIEEFITAIRSMNEKDTRLILKIHDPQSTNLFPDHHFLGKPCMVTNSQGDLIWAAYVEPCEALYEWVSSLGKNVEVLDPLKFKKEYLDYCEEKLKKVA